jgi:hypothetical protein
MMSVLITMKVAGDVSQFRQWIESEDRLREIADRAKAAGAIHHRFGVGDGFVLVVDEWDTAEHHHQFMAEIQDVFAEAGAQAAPEVTITEAVSTADEF